MEPFIYILAALGGLVTGSFLSVCIYRLPQGLSVVRPSSHCPHCKTAIPFYFNVPILSFLMLRGRCRECLEPIAFHYPLVEATTALLFVLIIHNHGVSAVAASHIVLTCGLVVIAVTDWQSLAIPRVVILALLAVGVALLGLLEPISVIDAFWGLLLGGGLLLLIAVGYRHARSRAGMGAGDVLVGAVIGIYLGWSRMPMFLVLASGTALAYAIYCMLKGKKGLADPIPFGSFLATWGIIFCVL